MHRFGLSLLLLLTFGAAPFVQGVALPPSGVPVAITQAERTLDGAIRKIQEFPEASHLMDRVRAQGPYTVVISNANTLGSEASWNFKTRMITLENADRRSEGSMIRSIVFELHNAIATKEILALRQRAMAGQISKKRYVEDLERLEYRNVKQASLLLEKGIAQGRFPKDAAYPVLPRFEEHYQIQHLTGHSNAIAEIFNQLCPFRRHECYIGPLGDVSSLTPKERNAMLERIWLAGSTS